MYRNLYVCDCSVIPEAWGLPPVLTLVGLGKRLARHLVAEQRPGTVVADESPPHAAVA
jgi:choline dehydrogenase-like flavoprotein